MLQLILLFLVMMVISFSLLESAYSFDSKVIIVNGTSSHCTPYLSCYEPFQVNIATGDTVTWINHDNRTHTVTTGTSNYGPAGIFDSGDIKPGKSFTQFFGSVGKYHYYDKTDMWPSGLVIVSKGFSHAELSWVPLSLKLEKQNYTSNGIVITKEIANTGNADANSVIFTLKIKNQTSLFYNNLVMMNIPAKQTVPIKFIWNNPINGQYQLFFDANSANSVGDMNANDDRSIEQITIPLPVQSVQTLSNFTQENNATVPEFGSMSYLILIMSLVSVLVLEVKLKAKLFS